MTRIEVFTNRSVEENLLEAFAEHGVARFYSKIPVVHGVGSAGPKQGDAIWPEENVAFIIYCEDEEAHLIKEAVAKVKEQYPDEGVKLFSLEQGWNEAQPRRRATRGGSGDNQLEAPDGSLALPAPKRTRKPRVQGPREKRALPPPPSFGGETV